MKLYLEKMIDFFNKNTLVNVIIYYLYLYFQFTFPWIVTLVQKIYILRFIWKKNALKLIMSIELELNAKLLSFKMKNKWKIRSSNCCTMKEIKHDVFLNKIDWFTYVVILFSWPFHMYLELLLRKTALTTKNFYILI